MAKRVLVLIVFASVMGCQQKQKTVEPEKLCPMYLPINSHEIAVSTTDVLPTNVAVAIDGVMKYDSCVAQPHLGQEPIVHFEKTVGGFNVAVYHYSAYQTLPDATSFEVFDRGDCSAAPTSYLAAAVPLQFSNVSRDPQCYAQFKASATVIK